MHLFIALFVVLYLHHKGLSVNEKNPEVEDYFQSILDNVPNTQETLGEPLVICLSSTVQESFGHDNQPPNSLTPGLTVTHLGHQLLTLQCLSDKSTWENTATLSAMAHTVEKRPSVVARQDGSQIYQKWTQ